MRSGAVQLAVLVGAATAALLALHETHAQEGEAAPGLVSDSVADSLQILWEIDTGG